MTIIMWILLYVCIIPVVETFQYQHFQTDFKDLLNYHKSVHLFIKDWLDDSYGKVNFTENQKAYYNSLATDSLKPEINILSFSSHVKDDILLKELATIFDSFNNELHNHLGFRHKREADGPIAQLKQMAPGPAKRKMLLQFKLNRLLKDLPRNKLTEEQRLQKINTLRKLIDRINNKHPGNDEYKDTEDKDLDGGGPPSSTATSAPPPVKPSEAQPPNAPTIPTPMPTAPPIPTPPHPPPPFEAIPTSNPHNIDDIFGRRKKRGVNNNDRKNYQHLTDSEMKIFRDALKHLTKRIDNLSQYDVFVKTHRLTESPLAYSQENSYIWNKQFLERFESALQQYDPSVTIPYLDLCGLIETRGFENLPMWSDFLNTEVISECAWIGHTLKRHVVPSNEIIRRLNATLNCNSRSLHPNMAIDRFAEVNALFGSCEAGGSHLACPSCAVTDPFYWMIYSDIQRRI